MKHKFYSLAHSANNSNKIKKVKEVFMKRIIYTLIITVFLLSTSGLLAQSLQIKGTVRDDKGPLRGVTVIAKKSKSALQTDVAGNFTIQTSVGDTLVFTSAGYISEEVVVDNRTEYSVTMIGDVRSLEGVVVIGYGSKKKQYLTGAVSTVGAEVLQSKPITNSLAALQGEIPGTYIQRYSGQPGSEDYNLNVRGPSSKNGAGSPLVLIDGVVGSLDLLNPADIESISVLKDAQASIYGARAAGGVFLVTTKKGKGGAPKITYNNNSIRGLFCFSNLSHPFRGTGGFISLQSY